MYSSNLTNLSSFGSDEKVNDDTVSNDLAVVLVCDDRVVAVVIVAVDDDALSSISVSKILSRRFEVSIRKSVLIQLLWLQSSLSSLLLLVVVVAAAAAAAAAASVDVLLRVVRVFLLAAWVSSLPIPTSNDTDKELSTTCRFRFDFLVA